MAKTKTPTAPAGFFVQDQPDVMAGARKMGMVLVHITEWSAVEVDKAPGKKK